MLLVTTMNKIFKPGKIVTGKVTGITNYGIFVKLENEYFGMIHISEISDGFVRNIDKYAKIGDVINCQVLSVNSAEKQVKLSIKNINYKNCQNNINSSSFSILKKNLDIWIKEKKAEMEERRNIFKN